jgi:hypothetical protein
LRPLSAGNLRRIARLAAIEQNLTLLPAPDEMAPALQVSDPAPSMSMQWNHISRRNAGMKNTRPLVFQQQAMVSRRRYERVE